jgi:hypothetical protein
MHWLFPVSGQTSEIREVEVITLLVPNEVTRDGTALPQVIERGICFNERTSLASFISYLLSSACKREKNRQRR